MRYMVLLVVVGLLVSASAAAAQVSERIRVSTAGGQLTQRLPAGLRLWVTSPPTYNRAAFDGNNGRWVGPRFVATGDNSVGGETSIAWSLRFVQARDAVAAATAAVQRDWPVDLRGGLSVPHVVGRRTVGTILGHYRLIHPAAADAAAYELGIAFAVAPGVFAQLRFDFPLPATESAGAAGLYTVNGLPASVWNRGQALWAMTGVELHGALPPARVSANVSAAGVAVRGVVADVFKHPVARARVALQRFSGGSWRRVASTRTNVSGVYALRGIAPRGRYRAVPSVGSASVRSAPVVAGRGTRPATQTT
jgi:hypothetical protein